ncbi:hypothetical protein [Pseudarthrobacter sp. BRE9]|uniref:hypothetical protein n=1 Tax=Pseudarthrobacter sp. BRE9 TaxID=2962582 RepID=UPI0028811F06|nr:hypothetical protein [Pseudarthrobacter sp. BRE9]MDT0169457.1 hypothetical protein [Pseudarthrobacter sp. BRE9]
MKDAAARDIELVRDLLQRSELASIEFHEVSAKRFEGVPDSEEPHEGQISLGFQHRADLDGFGIRIVGDVAVAIGEVRVVAAVEYKLLHGEQPPRRNVELFANEVAVMTLFPYLREGIASITSKVFGAPITLPVAERGQIGFEVSEADE